MLTCLGILSSAAEMFNTTIIWQFYLCLFSGDSIYYVIKGGSPAKQGHKSYKNHSKIDQCIATTKAEKDLIKLKGIPLMLLCLSVTGDLIALFASLDPLETWIIQCLLLSSTMHLILSTNHHFHETTEIIIICIIKLCTKH